MARYPTFEEYRKRGNFHDGIKRCDDLLKKNPNDVQLLIVKLQLLYATAGDAQVILQQLSSLQPSIVDLGEIVTIEDAVENAQRDVYPQLNTAGQTVATMWENALKASTSINHKLDLLSLRFSRAVVDNRLLDAQQALIQLKALQPKNRTIYMAHMAITQLLSSSKEDLQSRLALSLARKAVKENFDQDESLDCRVPGQIFAVQASAVDLESISGRRFSESKHVYDARKTNASQLNGHAQTQPALDPTIVPTADWLSSEVESLKQQFARLISSSAPLSSIVSFAANSIRLLHTAMRSTSNPRGRGLADSCFLSVSALVRTFQLCNDSRHLLHAALLTEVLLKHNPHVHEARLILVYLYMNLGLGSLAMQMFNSLNVKEIQHDTVGHALFTRLSTTHPHSTRVSKRDVFDPQKKLSHAVGVYTRHEEKMAEAEASVLNHEQTGMLFDLRELRNRLRSSITRRIIYLEQRRIARLFHSMDGGVPTQMRPRLSANWLNFTDNRDFVATFDYGYNIEKVLHGRNDAFPGRTWILFSLVADCAWCLARGTEMPVKDPETLVDELSTMELDVDRLQIGDDQTAKGDLTRAELLAGRLAYQVLKVLLLVTSEVAEIEESVGAVLKAVRSLDVDSVVTSKALRAEGVQDSYILLDSLRIVLIACTYMSGKTSKCQTELRDIQSLVGDKCRVLLETARSQAKRLNGGAIKTNMEQDELIRDSVKLFGEASLTELCNSVASSAQQGWEGLMMIKVG